MTHECINAGDYVVGKYVGQFDISSVWLVRRIERTPDSRRVCWCVPVANKSRDQARIEERYLKRVSPLVALALQLD